MRRAYVLQVDVAAAQLSPVTTPQSPPGVMILTLASFGSFKLIKGLGLGSLAAFSWANLVGSDERTRNYFTQSSNDKEGTRKRLVTRRSQDKLRMRLALDLTNVEKKRQNRSTDKHDCTQSQLTNTHTD